MLARILDRVIYTLLSPVGFPEVAYNIVLPSSIYPKATQKASLAER